MVEFVQKLLRETLEVPLATELGIERAHRPLAPRSSGDREDKPINQVSPLYNKREDFAQGMGEKEHVFERETDLFRSGLPPSLSAKG